MHSMEIYRAYLDARTLAEELLTAHTKLACCSKTAYRAETINRRFSDVKSSTPVAMAILNAVGGRDA